MATSEQMERGLQIAREVREEMPDAAPGVQTAEIGKRWRAVERDVARMRRRPR